MTVDIREMTLDDYDAAAALWETSEGVGLHRDAEDSRDGIGRLLERNPGLSFVASDGDGLIGTVVGSQDGRRGYLRHLAVASSRRRHGIGRALVGRCLAAMKKAGLRRCNLHVFEGNTAARAFWESLGWAGRGDILYMSGPTEPETGRLSLADVLRKGKECQETN